MTGIGRLAGTVAMIAAGIAILFTGCTTPEPIAFEKIRQGVQGLQNMAATDSREFVIQTADEWSSLWKSSPTADMNTKPATTPNFQEQMVIGVAKHAPTGGVTLEFTDIVKSGKDIQVAVNIVLPGKGCAVTMAITKPHVFAIVPKSDLPVRFGYKEVRKDCW